MTSHTKSPHIVFILIDGLGWNDVSWNNPDVKTPTLELLGNEGINLNQFYVQPTGTASRAALLTGQYPFKTGFQHDSGDTVLREGLPRHQYILPEKLKEMGYTTHMIGKWDLGICDVEDTSLKRGFDTFYGYYFHKTSTFTHSFTEPLTGLAGLNFYDHTGVVGYENGTSVNELLSRRVGRIISGYNTQNPLFMMISVDMYQLSNEESIRFGNMYSEIENEEQRNRYGMISALDMFVDDVKSQLQERDLWEDTLLVFSSTSGGDTNVVQTSNYPLKGGTGSVFEGGTRVPTVLYGRPIMKTGYVNNDVMHIVDWFPTLLSMVREDKAVSGAPLDGLDVSDTIINGAPSTRKEIIYNIDLDKPTVAAVRHGDYKLIERQFQAFSIQSSKEGDQSVMGYNVTEADGFLDISTKQLYNIKDDPAEEVDLIESQPEKVMELHQILIHSLSEVKATKSAATREDLNRAYYNGVWVPGRC
ncbi:arylsulfatase J-like isoform X2 [Glandiceps talaboti]